MEIHKLLKRQLDKANIKADNPPQSMEQWLAFITRINKTYLDADQERYMQNRSIEISSREMTELNEKLEKAQHLAKLGYWSYDRSNNHIIWSKELFTIFHLNFFDLPPTYSEFIELVHEQDRYDLAFKSDRALNENIDYECEARVKIPDGTYHWYRIIGQCRKGEKLLEGIIIDIHQDKMAEEKIQKLNEQLFVTAHRAGMAEVAITILHNIGNILNSANISINIIKNNLKKTHVKTLFKVLEIMSQHQEDMSHFLSKDPHGQIIPQYLMALLKELLDENQTNIFETDNLIKQLEHINEIVAMQNSISGVVTRADKIYIPELIEQALNMSLKEPKYKIIQIIRKFHACPLVYSDKSKLLQILVNLIQNASESVLQNSSISIPHIKLTIKRKDKETIQLVVEDNGVGIDPNHLNRIFSFGYTTKKKGHGFGLHSSALAIKNLGGSLHAESLGLNHGAKLVIIIPIKNKKINLIEKH